MSGPHPDVVVVGAGSVGVPISWALARSGVRVTVVDEAASAGQGANKAAIGGVRATHADPAKIRVGCESLRTFATWHDSHGDDLEWVTGGYAFVAYRAQEEATFRALLEVQRRHGLDIDWLDRDALLGRAPDLERDGLRGGTFSPGDGHGSTLLASHALYDAARRAGATFRFGERVTGLTVARGRVRGLVTDRGTYAADVVVNAAGGSAAAIAALAGERLDVRADLHEAAITEPVAPFLGPMVVDVRPGPGSANAYFYQSQRGQVIFCLTPDPPIWGEDRRATSVFLPQVARRLVALMPRLRHLRVRRTWRGVYPMTPDGSPLVGWSEGTQGLLHAAGMCGQGFMLGPGIGTLVARMVRGTTTSDDAQTLAAWAPQRAFAGQEALR
ncbi:MAG: NAD(P)/FAD-dependent oxidoreductase [Trueperaceae bacterium]